MKFHYNIDYMNNKKLGFTLIELLVVIVIIGILATISIATFGNYQKDAKIAALTSEATSNYKKILADCTAGDLRDDCSGMIPFSTTKKVIVVVDVVPDINGTSIANNLFRFFGAQTEAGGSILFRTYGGAEYAWVPQSGAGYFRLKRSDFLASEKYRVIMFAEEESGGLRARIYVNGEEKLNELYAGASINSPTAFIKFGSWYYSGTNYIFPGTVRAVGAFSE